jgi:hypothetical protein
MRVCGWVSLLTARLEAAGDRPFAWGSHDCATWAFDLRRDLTGGADVAADWRGRYTTPLGAQRVMRRLGWHDLEAMGRDLLGDPRATPLLAQRGDIVLGGEDPAFGICAGARAAFVAPQGLVQLPLAACALAWRV